MKKTYTLVKTAYGRYQVARIIKDIFEDCSNGITEIEVKFL